MEEVGPFALIGLVVFVIVAVLVIVGLVAFVILGATGVMALNGHTERKRQAREAEPDDAW
jgi:Flp pilus assembly protein TadB